MQMKFRIPRGMGQVPAYFCSYLMPCFCNGFHVHYFSRIIIYPTNQDKGTLLSHFINCIKDIFGPETLFSLAFLYFHYSLFRIKIVKSNLGGDHILITWKRLFFTNNFEPLFIWPVKRDH